MKKILVSILTLCFAAMSVQVSAEAYTDEQGVVYEITGVVGKVTGYVGKLPNIVIPSPVKVTGSDKEFYVNAIDRKAFENNEYLECITLPEDLKYIREYAFCNCKMLYKVVFAEGTKMDTIDNRAFSDCIGLLDIEVPAYLDGDGIVMPRFKSTSSQTFYNFQNAPNVGYHFTVSDKRKYPKGYDHNWGAKMKNGIVSGYLLYEEEDTEKTTLKCCSKAARGSIVIPESTTKIISGAFVDCKHMTSVVIPASVSTVESRIFTGCSGLTSIVCKCTTPPVSAYYDEKTPEFVDVDKSIPVYVPEGLISAYQNAKGWNQFNNYQPWSKEAEEELSKCTLTLSVNDENMGSVTGAGTYDGGSDVKIEATAKEGFIFVQWSDGVTENPRTLKVTSDMTMIAIFKDKNADPDKFLVTLMVSDPNAGEVTGSGSYALGETVIIEAKAKDGYKFVNWSDGNTSPVRTLIIDKNLALTANFEAIGAFVTITASVNDTTMGIVQGAGKYAENAQVKLLAIPREGYQFVQWSDGDKSNPRMFVATKDSAFVAEFAAKSEEPKDEALEGVQSTEYRVQKTVIDGQLYIIRENAIYDARGKRVK